MKDMLTNPMIRKLTAFFLFAIIADGLLGVAVNLAGSLFTDFRVLTFLSALIELGVLLFGVVLLLGMMITPRLSKRILLPPVLFWVFTFGCQSLGDPGRMEFLFPLAEVLLGLGLLVWYRGCTEASLWKIQKTCDARPLFTLRNFILTGLLNGTIVCCCVAGLTTQIYLALAQDNKISTDDYMSIEPSGIWMDERVFRKCDQEIRLFGMIHIAQRDFYDDVAKSLPAASRSIVLSEGVRDRHNRLNKEAFDNRKMAQMFGLTSQVDTSFTKKVREGLKETNENRKQGNPAKNLEYKNADVDFSDFKPETQQFLKTISKFLSCKSLKDGAKFIFSPENKHLDTKSPDIDILDFRNKYLIGEIDAALKTHSTVIVPWGSAHMPAIQAQIEKWGFVETYRTRHAVVSFKNEMLKATISLIFKLRSLLPRK